MNHPAALLVAVVLLAGACSSVATTASTTTTLPATTTTAAVTSATAAGIDLVEPGGFSVVSLEWDDGSETQALEVFLADNNGRRKRGLMGVTSLGEADGMAFVWDSLHEGGFWMKDTLIALDIAFVNAESEVIAVMTMQPCQKDPCPSVGPEDAYLFAFESVAGAFDIKVGDLMRVGTASR